MPSHASTESAPARRPRRRSDAAPLDRAWLEERALRYVARWESSALGVEELLERKVRERCRRTGEPIDPGLEPIPSVVAKLVARGWVDDRRFAAGTLTRLRRQGGSRRRIRATLRAKGVAAELIDELLADEPPDAELEAAWRLARRKRLGPFCREPSERDARRDRHLGVLGRSGFDLDVARAVVDAEEPPEGR